MSLDAVWHPRGAASFGIDAFAAHPLTRGRDNIASTLKHSAAVGD